MSNKVQVKKNKCSLCIFVTPEGTSCLLYRLLEVRRTKDGEGQHVTSPQCVFSVEHGVIWPLDSSTTSMKAGVNSGDACDANRL